MVFSYEGVFHMLYQRTKVKVDTFQIFSLMWLYFCKLKSEEITTFASYYQ